MSSTWQPKQTDDGTPALQLTALGCMLLAVRGVLLLGTLGVGLAVFFAVRLLESIRLSNSRSLSPFVTLVVCRLCLLIIGIAVERRGLVDNTANALVSNHVSWLDVFVLNSSEPIYFVSKSEVASWPLIGLLARVTGTLFIHRKRTQAAQHVNVMQERMSAGHKLAFFPEGTSTDGLQIITFKSSLFESFFVDDRDHSFSIQPVSLKYIAPKEKDARFYGWWGDMTFGAHLLTILSSPRQGRVIIDYSSAICVQDYTQRKQLSAVLQGAVCQSFALDI